jgi:ribosomal protein S12 methylthiotransferase
MKLAFISLGCPKNAVDLETVLAGIDSHVELVDDAAEADAVLINTCAFIESAKQESIDTILEIVQIKKDRPQFRVLVSGCLPQRYREELAQVLPEVDAFFDSTDAKQTRRQLREFLQLPTSCHSERKRLTPPHYAYLRIADGCDNRCSYCAIPLIKGGYRSRSLDEILQEAEILSQEGALELNLVAQDITRYGRDLQNQDSLVKLLQRLSDIPRVQWLRLLYTHPAHWSEALMEAVAGLDKVVKYVDLPIQHITDHMLERMRRHTTRQAIETLIETMRMKIPGLALRTTVMVGFPGETEKDFRELLHFIENTRFERLGVFAYSNEEGTEASLWRDSVPRAKKEDRQNVVMETQAIIAGEHNAAMIGRELRVLVDEVMTETRQSIARTAWDAPEIDNTVIVEGNLEPGKFYAVKIQGADTYDLFAQPLEMDQLRVLL